MNDQYIPKFRVGDYIHYLDTIWKVDTVSDSDDGPVYGLKSDKATFISVINCQKNDPYLRKV